jgi:DNA polymerase elongation subunit (family B)
LKEYNLQDAKLIKMLEDKLNLLKIQFKISSFAGLLIGDTNYMSRIVDTIIFRKLIKQTPRLILRNRQMEVNNVNLPGGYVHQPERALYHWIYEFDFKSLYPSIIITFNIGLDTNDINGEILTEKARFTNKYEAAVAKILREIRRMRDEAKIERDKYPINSPEWNEHHALQIALKTISNSFWGVLGESVGRMFDVDLAASVTLTGQAILKETMGIMEKLGLKTLYGDSVVGETLVPIIKNGIIYKTTVEDLFENYIDKVEIIGEKEYIDLSEENLETFAIDEDGRLQIRKIKKVIRHKTSKKIFKINTFFGPVCVTEDHSLIVKKPDGYYPCQAKDLNTDSKLIYLDIDYSSMCYLRKKNKKLLSLHSSPQNKEQTTAFGEVSQRSLSTFSDERSEIFSRKIEENVGNNEGCLEKTRIQATSTSSRWGEIRLESKTLEQRVNQSYCPSKIQGKYGETGKENFAEAKEIFFKTSGSNRENKAKYCKNVSDALYYPGEINGRDVVENIKNSKRQNIISISTGHNQTGFCDKYFRNSSGNLCGWMFSSLLSKTFAGSVEGYTKTNNKSRRGSDEIFGNEWCSDTQILGVRNKGESSEDFGYGEETDFRYFGETPILSVEDKGSTTQYVYDLEVDGCHTFLANKIFVHNTDSLALKVPEEIAKTNDGEEIKRKGKILEGLVNNILKNRLIKKYNIPPERYCIVLEFQELFYKMFFTGKKKQYIGLVYSREKMATLRGMSTGEYGINLNTSLVGFSMKKYNTCHFLKFAQKKILNTILNSNSLDEARDEVKKICENIRNLLYSHALDNTLIQRTGVRKDLDNYKVNSIQSVLGRQLQSVGLFRRGDVLDYVIVDVKDGKLIPKVVVNKNEVIHPTAAGLKYYERLLNDMVERLIGEKLNLQDFELDIWFG